MFETVFRKIIRLITKPFLGVLKRFVALLLCNRDFRDLLYRYALRQKSKGKMSFLRVEVDGMAKYWNDFFDKQTSLSLSQCMSRLLSGLDELSKESAMLLYGCRNIRNTPEDAAGLLYGSYSSDALLPLFPLLQKEHNILEKRRDDYKCPFIMPEEAKNIITETEMASDFGLCYFPDDVRVSIQGRDVIDGGGCVGDSALSFTQYQPKNVYVFEPNPDSFSAMKAVIDANIGKMGGGGGVLCWFRLH